MLKVLVDADSMRIDTRAIILRRAVAETIETVFAADRHLADVEDAIRAHTIALRAPLRGQLDKSEIRKVKSTISMCVVDSAPGAADDYLVSICDDACLVVSHDIPLLARCIEKGALAIDDRGGEWNAGNIGVRLSERTVNADFREMGLFAEQQKRMDARTTKAFADTFDRVLSRALKLF